MYRVFIYAITVMIKSAFATGILFFSQEQCTETKPLSQNAQNLIQVINLRLLIIDGLLIIVFSINSGSIDKHLMNSGNSLVGSWKSNQGLLYQTRLNNAWIQIISH